MTCFILQSGEKKAALNIASRAAEDVVTNGTYISLEKSTSAETTITPRLAWREHEKRNITEICG